MQLYLVRHGATAVNEQGLYQGWTDVGLSEAGRRQCELVREKLSRVEFDLVMSSPLERAVSSARLISGLGRERIVTEAAFKEINFGAWEGLSYREAAEGFPVEWQAWCSDWVNYGPPRGENFTVFQRRVGAACERLVTGYGGKNVLLVSHAGTMRCIVNRLLDLPVEAFWRFSFESGCYSLVEIRPDAVVLKKLNC